MPLASSPVFFCDLFFLGGEKCLESEEKPARQAVVTVDRVDYALQANELQPTFPPSLRFLPGFHLRQVSAFESMNEMLSAVQSHFLYWENEAASRWVCMSTVGDKEEKLQVDLNLMS